MFMPTVFITGATGFIGRALCVKMLENGWNVSGTYRDVSGDKLPAGVKGIKIGTIENYDKAYEDLRLVDAVIHLAGRAHMINDKVIDPLSAYRSINVGGTECLARGAAKAGVKKFIFISSIKVNCESSQLPCTEKDLPMPGDPYGVSKYEAEEVLKTVASETGIKIIILRLPLVYGPGVKANFGNLIKLVASGIPLPLKNIHNRRSLIYIGNLTDAIFTSVVNPKAENETFMVSDCIDLSTPDLIRSIAAVMGRKAFLFPFPTILLKALGQISGKSRVIDRLAGSLFADTQKIRDVLGWRPPFTIEEGIRQTVRSFKS